MPPGKKAVIYGSITKKKDGLYIYKPQFIAKSKKQLVTMLENQRDISGRLLIIFGVVLLPLIGWSIFKIIKLLIKYIEDRKQRMVDQ